LFEGSGKRRRKINPPFRRKLRAEEFALGKGRCLSFSGEINVKRYPLRKGKEKSDSEKKNFWEEKGTLYTHKTSLQFPRSWGEKKGNKTNLCCSEEKGDLRLYCHLH